jgi:hypothetical protein
LRLLLDEMLSPAIALEQKLVKHPSDDLANGEDWL